MILGNPYNGPRQSCLSTCRLIRLKLSAATLSSFSCASQRRAYAWGSQFQKPGQAQTLSGPVDRPPSQEPRSARPSPFSKTPPSQTLPSNHRAGQSLNHFAKSPPSRTDNQRQGGWGRLSSNPHFNNGSLRRAPLAFEPIQKKTGNGSDTRNGAPRSKEDFWNELDSRIGRGTADTDRAPQRAPQRAAFGHAHRTRQPPRTSGTQPRQEKRRGQGREDLGGSRPTNQWADAAPQQAVPELDIDVNAASYTPMTFDTETDIGRRKKQRKEKPEKTKSKPRSQYRSSGRRLDDDDDYDYDEEIEDQRQRRKAEKLRQKAEAAAASGPVPILLPQYISVANLGAALRVKPHIFLRNLGQLGFENITLENVMTGETAALIAQEFGYEPTVDTGETVDLKRSPVPEDPSTLPERPPIVTIMGHVDHGKTTMLDWLRRSSVAAQEHGGITQHIGAFSVKLSSGKQITFLDTPGHAAFLTMRQRGANVTDIVILVVAADDSVKPQTLEALKHARAANVPIIVAINKIDKDEARVDQVKADLARHGVEIEDYGGDVQVACVSGKTGEGMDSLEENILTLSEILDVRADPGGLAEGWVLESSVKSQGRSASVLVKRGTMRKGDIVAAGTAWAKIRTLRNEAGMEVDEAPPGMPVEVLGWRELPDAGDEVLQAPNEARVREAINYRIELKSHEKAASEQEAQEKREMEKAALAAANTELDDAASKGKAWSITGVTDTAPEDQSGPKKISFTVKGDVMGSVEAVCAAITEIGNNEVQSEVLRSAPGAVTEYDIEHAATTKSAVINFNMPLTGSIKKLAEELGVTIMDHTVIYHLVDEVKGLLSSYLPPLITNKVLGEAEVLQVFPINLRGKVYKNIAGCRVRNGQVTRNGLYRVFRKNKVIFDGKLDALKHGKKDADEMRKGTECGISFEEFDDIEVGDKIQAYEEIHEKRHL
ncbi:translation initiation factor IF-2 [Sporothrix eucalyptigena]|uniref:Translation initiation factor IF-2, mitochondrial n=1 Tax=Sporothrix eucalyptigena TaxID=1812306 RepID=A0ABP0BBY0_9PEZI